ncbi:hypothetical protein DBR42_07530 [Pelomonas sp. HMWF004]|nr:hypothetical protein DBR42_07530 [Pelomonas sp. HMWF004]
MGTLKKLSIWPGEFAVGQVARRASSSVDKPAGRPWISARTGVADALVAHRLDKMERANSALFGNSWVGRFMVPQLVV